MEDVGKIQKCHDATTVNVVWRLQHRQAPANFVFITWNLFPLLLNFSVLLATRLEDVLKTSWKTKYCYAEDVLKTSWRHVLKTSWRNVFKTSWRHVLKTSWRQTECLLGISVCSKAKCVFSKSIFHKSISDKSKANPKCIN